MYAPLLWRGESAIQEEEEQEEEEGRPKGLLRPIVVVFAFACPPSDICIWTRACVSVSIQQLWSDLRVLRLQYHVAASCMPLLLVNSSWAEARAASPKRTPLSPQATAALNCSLRMHSSAAVPLLPPPAPPLPGFAAAASAALRDGRHLEVILRWGAMGVVMMMCWVGKWCAAKASLV